MQRWSQTECIGWFRGQTSDSAKKQSKQYRSETQGFLELFLDYFCIAYELFNKAHIGYPTHSYA